MRTNNFLRLNVGFLLKEGVGYSREFQFGEPHAQVADDLDVTNLRGRVRLTRTPQGLYANGQIAGDVRAECGRCLEEVSQPLTARIAELFIYPPEHAARGEAVVGEEGFINLAPIVREDMLLSAPMQALCRDDCKGLCPQCGANRNTETCACTDETSDPRLAALKSLLEK
ncbi:MAG: DUF177 domain-containing protein [Chloroflexi bacterium]|nr:DUF177 domain-containing protein [Chloroflexota bacterium]MBI3762697.1 DUF177 domain-containing protein [Chloroflexota bacterium]